MVNSFEKEGRKANKKLIAFAPSFTKENKELIAELSERGNEYASLKGAEQEVKSIIQLMSGQLYTDSLATERNFKEHAANFKILHVATHGILNDHDPMSSRLVFYQDNDTVEDGNLYAYEIYNMQLNADLAVLSACNTGSGKLQEGEGIMNLARGFLYAGVPGIVMSLWSVNDLSSAEIMKGFYSYLKSGLSKSEALQKAKKDYIVNVDNLTANPYYWAGFVIIGNQHEISFKPNTSLSIVFLSSLVVAVIVILGRKRYKQKK
ncbi:MAG: CHAT domain-containing protein [Bacteroidales bacterium]